MTTETTTVIVGTAGLGRGGRMSCQRNAVLRLLWGEDLETVSRGLA